MCDQILAKAYRLIVRRNVADILLTLYQIKYDISDVELERYRKQEHVKEVRKFIRKTRSK